MGEGETDREIAALEDSSSRKRKRNAAIRMDTEGVRVCARRTNGERERERGRKASTMGRRAFYSLRTPLPAHTFGLVRV